MEQQSNYINKRYPIKNVYAVNYCLSNDVKSW